MNERDYISVDRLATVVLQYLNDPSWAKDDLVRAIRADIGQEVGTVRLYDRTEKT